jgi:hypothetical protein
MSDSRNSAADRQKAAQEARRTSWRSLRPGWPQRSCGPARQAEREAQAAERAKGCWRAKPPRPSKRRARLRPPPRPRHSSHAKRKKPSPAKPHSRRNARPRATRVMPPARPRARSGSVRVDRRHHRPADRGGPAECGSGEAYFFIPSSFFMPSLDMASFFAVLRHCVVLLRRPWTCPSSWRRHVSVRASGERQRARRDGGGRNPSAWGGRRWLVFQTVLKATGR